MLTHHICVSCAASFPHRRGKDRNLYCSPQCHSAMRRNQREELFWAQVNTSGPIPQHAPELGPCWVWTGNLHTWGYGRFGKPKDYAHRLSWRFTHGTDPGDAFVCHHCDNPPCVRPDHLFLGTQQANLGDMSAKGRALRGERATSAKLTSSDVKAIRERYASGGESLTTLAAVYNVNFGTIGKIVRGERWRHIL